MESSALSAMGDGDGPEALSPRLQLAETEAAVSAVKAARMAAQVEEMRFLEEARHAAAPRPEAAGGEPAACQNAASPVLTWLARC